MSKNDNKVMKDFVIVRKLKEIEIIERVEKIFWKYNVRFMILEFFGFCNKLIIL